jgi:hypothetical protein
MYIYTQCAAVLAIVAENGENQINLIKDGVLPRLVHLSTVNNLGIYSFFCLVVASIVLFVPFVYFCLFWLVYYLHMKDSFWFLLCNSI